MKPPHTPIGDLSDPADVAKARAAIEAAPKRRYHHDDKPSTFKGEPVHPPISDRLDSPRAARWSAFMAHALQGILAAPPEARDGRTEAAPLAALYADDALRLHDLRFKPAPTPDPLPARLRCDSTFQGVACSLLRSHGGDHANNGLRWSPGPL